MSEKNFASYGDMETLVTELVDKCGPYREITYEDWLQLTPYQQEHGRWDVTGVPGADGTVSIDLMTKLWENPNPTSSFAEQSITLSSSDYDMLLIVFKVSTSSARHCSELTVKGSGATLSIAEYTSNVAANLTRYFIYSTETVYIISPGFINGAQDNNIIIPYQIYGIKLHHTVEIRAIAPEVSTLAKNSVFDPTGTDLESTNAEDAIKELESNFQDGVDAVYDAVVAKGSTPASHSLSDVVDGIASIETSPPTQTKSCTPSTSAQTITPDSGYLLSSVSVSAIQTQTKSCTPSTSAQTISPDSGKYLSSVSVSAISTQSKTITASRSKQTVTPDSGKYLSSVVVNKYTDASGNYTCGSNTGAASSNDMGATNNYRYVDATKVYAKGKSDGAASGTGGVTLLWCFQKIRTIMSSYSLSHSFSAGSWGIVVGYLCHAPSWNTSGITVNTIFNEGGLQIYSCYKASAYGCTFTQKTSGGFAFSFVMAYP